MKQQTAAATTVGAAITPPPPASLVRSFATKLGVEPSKMLSTLKDTAFKQSMKNGQPGPEVSDAQMMALLVVANEYGLNPFTREIYAFPAKGGGIVPIISVDGWIRIINSRPELRSIEFDYAENEDDNPWIACTITRSDRDKPLTVREYLVECKRDTDPWREMPHRMLRHKALIQCARVAFGYGGIYDPDEAERIANAMAIDVTATEVRGKPETRAPQAKLAAPAAERMPDLAEVRRLLDVTGVPDNELFAHFEIGGFGELDAAMQVQAIEWLKGVNNGS